MKSGGFQPFGKPNDWERRDDASHVGHNRWDGYHSRRATQPWSVSRPKDVAPGWWRSYLGSDRGPETGLFLSHPVPPWPRLRSGSGCCERWLYRTRHSVNNNNNNNNTMIYQAHMPLRRSLLSFYAVSQVITRTTESR